MLEKWPYLDQNHGLTLLEKSKFFEFLNFLFFYCLQRRFFVLDYRQSHFPYQYCLKKMMEKWPYLDQNHGLTPLEKCQFFDILNFLFLQPRKAFFQSRISKKSFFRPILSKKQSSKNGQFWTKNHGLTPLEKLQFFDILNFLFLQPRKEFFRSRIS